MSTVEPGFVPPQSRREMRQQQEAEARRGRRAWARRTLRGTILGALAVATIAAPLSGFLGPNMSIALPGRQITGIDSDPSLLQMLAESESPLLANDGSLQAVPAALSRARVLTAVEEGVCVRSGASANGDLSGADVEAPLVWPLPQGSYQITSPFGWRVAPITGGRNLHSGMDMASPLGTPIFAAAAGVVTHAGPYAGGYAIYIKHEAMGETFYTGYLHMYADGIFVKKGDQVKAGQHIANVGSSGWSTGPHLHFEVRTADKEAINPDPWMKSHGAVFTGVKCH